MILVDINGDEWCYIKIPRTASKAYMCLFDKEFDKNIKENEFYPQGHAPHSNLCKIMKDGTRYFTIVRNPVDRFISSLKYMFMRRDSDYRIHFTLPNETTEQLIEFLYSNFDKNCIPKNKTLEQIFNINLSWFEGSFFRTQAFWADNNVIKVFKYENLIEFNTWLDNRFNIKTTELREVGTTKNYNLSHINFQDINFIKLTEHLFYEDFVKYNYNLTTV